MNKNMILITFTVLIILAIGSSLFYVINGSTQDVDCEHEYDQAVEGEIEPSQISSECEPLPEDIENQLLVQALGDT